MRANVPGRIARYGVTTVGSNDPTTVRTVGVKPDGARCISGPIDTLRLSSSRGARNGLAPIPNRSNLGVRTRWDNRAFMDWRFSKSRSL